MSDDLRQQILEIFGYEVAEVSPSRLAATFEQPRRFVEAELAALEREGLVRTDDEGPWRRYSLTAKGKRHIEEPDVEGFWYLFAEGAARAFWAEAYIQEVKSWSPRMQRKLGPGSGGRWEDVLPPVPEAAEAQGERFAKRAEQRAPSAVVEAMRELGGDTAGFSAAMGAMDTGAGLVDHDIEDRWVGHEDPGVDVQNAAVAAVNAASRKR